MHLKIYRHKIDWYCSIIDLQKIISILINSNEWHGYVLLTKKENINTTMLNIQLNKDDNDLINIENNEYTILLSKDTFGVLVSYIDMFIQNRYLYFSHELNDLFFSKTKKWISFYVYITSCI